MSLTINTNLSSLIAQNSLKTSTNKLNQAIERMTTGAKINHAKDNAANYAIATNMTTQLSSLDVAEENTAMGLDLLTTANEMLDLINERTERLRNLAVQAENGTYGKDSLNAINAECVSLVAEIKNLYSSAEYNGIKILGQECLETIATNATSPISTMSLETFATKTILATENTTLLELGINASSFGIYNSAGALIESYDTEKGDTLQDIFNVLSNYGLDSSMNDGIIQISSTNGNYVNGDLINILGITLKSEDYISSTEQALGSKIYYTLSQAPTEATTLADLGVLTSGTDTIIINDKYQDLVAKITVTSSTTLGGLFNELGKYDIQGSIDDSCITLSSSSNNYVVSNGVIQSLGITNNTVSSIVTTGTGQTSSGTISYETVTANSGTVTTVQEVQTKTIWTTTTTSQTVTSTVWTTTTSSSTKTDTIWTTTTSSTTQTNTIWVTTTTSQTTTETVISTVGTTATSTDKITYTSSSRLVQVVQIYEGVAGQTPSSYVIDGVMSSYEISGNTFLITSSQDILDMQELSKNGETFAGKTFILGADIDLCSATDFTGIVDFSGTFLGGGHTIAVDMDLGFDEMGFFNRLTNATVRGLELTGTITESGSDGGFIGALAGFATNSHISSVVTSVYLTSQDGGFIGGLVGNMESGRIQNCYVKGGIYAFGTSTDTSTVGGLVGHVNYMGMSEYTSVEIVSCGFVGVINGGYTIGGLVGGALSTSNLLLNNCYVKGSFTARNDATAGAFIGFQNTGKVTLNTCLNNSSLWGIGYCDENLNLAYCISLQSAMLSPEEGNCPISVWNNATECYDNVYGYADSEIQTLVEEHYSWRTWDGVKEGSIEHYALKEPTMQTTNINSSTTIVETTTATLSTSLYELGVHDTSYITIKCGDGTTRIVTVESSSTLEELKNQLGDEEYYVFMDVANGCVTIGEGPHYITGMSSELQNALNFENGTNSTVVNSYTTVTTTATTTTPTTQTSTIYTTTTSSSTKTSTIWTTTTSSTTKTNTVWTTTTSSSTKTETVNITKTTDATYTTSNVLMTSDSTFANLGVTSRTYITIKNNDTTQIITIKTADTVGDLISKLNKSGISATISDGKITLTPNKKSTYISGMSDSLKSALNLGNNFYSISDGFDMTDSNSLISNTTSTINRATNLSDLGITSGVLLVQKSGADYATITVSASETVNDFSNNLSAIGFNVSCENGKFKIKAAGDMILSESASNSSNAIAVLGLNNINKSVSSTYSNTDSEQLFALDEIVNSYWATSGSIALQVGITSDKSSRIEFDTGFVIANIDRFASIGKNTVTKFDYISELDSILEKINAKQVEFGAVQNRLESALDSIAVAYDNLVSSRSTIQDADIAELSSEYIKMQILQQASATLMATANQNPSIALQLL